jgi:uncharacterized phage-associated protein
MKIPIPKLQAMIRFFASNTDSRLLGKKKLMKLFYFADFMHVKKYASPITYDNYVHLEHGPIPSTILNLINAVENDNENALLAESLMVEIKENSLLKRVVPTRSFSENDLKYFTPSEFKILQNVCERFNDKTGRYIEERSHEEAAWRLTNELDDIPYTLATKDPDCLTDENEIRLALLVMN